jgi:enterochelin esterase-like enzyme
MIKHIILLVVFLIFASTTNAQVTGKVIENAVVTSKILNMQRKFAIYLPPDYATSDRAYPVLYLLHGAGDDQTGWVQFGEVLNITDKAIAEGKSTPMIIVMPDGNTGQRGYYNDPTNAWRYEDFFFEELMPYVEKTYRIKAEKRYRAISGLSMGGGGTFVYTLHKPDLFQSAAPLSAYCGPLTREELPALFERRGLFAKDPNYKPTPEQTEAFFKKYSVTDYINSAKDDDLKKIRWYIDCGDDDFLYEGNSLVHIAFKKRNIPHEYRVRDGAHNWTYWRQSLPEVLSFVSQGFHQY